MRYIIELGYKGTNFHGWQRQPNARSVQEEIETALTVLLKRNISINGSSRTDTGVHARQQFAHFDFAEEINTQKLTFQLNSFLKQDIVIYTIYTVSDDKHTRFDAIYRKYIYRIDLIKNPFNHEFSLLYQQNIDIDKMNAAAKILAKHTDFECFSKVKTEVNNFNCTIEEAFWIANNHSLEFHIQANRFLRGMVRSIVGTLLEVGRSKLTLSEFENIILSKNRNNAGRNVEAKGLTLEKVGYPEGYFA